MPSSAQALVSQALVAGLQLTETQASALAADNRDVIGSRHIPADVEAVGYISANGSHVILLDRSQQSICELRVREGLLSL